MPPSQGGIADQIVLVLDGGLVGGGVCLAGKAVAENLKQVAWVHGGSGRITGAREGQSDGGGADAGYDGEAGTQAPCSAARPYACTRECCRVLPLRRRQHPRRLAHMKGSVNCRTRFPPFDPVSRYSSPIGPITASRQERQIVQSWLNLGYFLP